MQKVSKIVRKSPRDNAGIPPDTFLKKTFIRKSFSNSKYIHKTKTNNDIDEKSCTLLELDIFLENTTQQTIH